MTREKLRDAVKKDRTSWDYALNEMSDEQATVLAALLDLGCDCKIRDRREFESQREWFKDCMCMFHWMETDYYQAKLKSNRFTGEVYDNPSTSS